MISIYLKIIFTTIVVAAIYWPYEYLKKEREPYEDKVVVFCVAIVILCIVGIVWCIKPHP